MMLVMNPQKKTVNFVNDNVISQHPMIKIDTYCDDDNEYDSNSDDHNFSVPLTMNENGISFV